ncbi:hypothetical protein KKG45_12920 [bacterium]|nr:hypothetical protein [bacterium]MBU1074142.1 hypothetical protein [bacterium]MBU1676427.1 hypothetical protein [bacterium]
MRLSRALAAAAILMAAAASFGQPTMDSLWPDEDGMRWEYRFHVFDHDGDIDFTSPAHLQLAGTAMTPGGEAQVLLAEHASVPRPGRNAPPALPPLLLRIWRARPDLREEIERRYGGASRSAWWPLFLHGGYFMKTADDIEMWQDEWPHRTWLYMEDDLTVGATFSMQLVPELADDIYLHGTVAAIDATVATPAGSFDDALKMDYLIDFGIQVATDEYGGVIGSVRGETVGHVHYVPGLGPVDMLEESIPYAWMDCGENDCPPEWEALLGVVVETNTLVLTRLPVEADAASWGAVKAMFR